MLKYVINYTGGRGRYKKDHEFEFFAKNDESALKIHFGKFLKHWISEPAALGRDMTSYNLLSMKRIGSRGRRGRDLLAKAKAS